MTRASAPSSSKRLIEKEAELEREREKEKEKDRSRERDREREREKEKERERNREREREKEKTGEKGKRDSKSGDKKRGTHKATFPLKKLVSSDKKRQKEKGTL